MTRRTGRKEGRGHYAVSPRERQIRETGGVLIHAGRIRARDSTREGPMPTDTTATPRFTRLTLVTGLALLLAACSSSAGSSAASATPSASSEASSAAASASASASEAATGDVTV